MTDSLERGGAGDLLADGELWISAHLTVFVPIVLASGCLCFCFCWLLLCARRRRKRQLKTQVLGRARTVPTAAPSRTEGLRSASAAALRSARDKLATGFESPTGVLAQQRLSYSPVALGAGVEAMTDDWSDAQGSSAPPASRRPPSSGSNVLLDQQKTARAHAQNWLEGAMTMATSPCNEPPGPPTCSRSKWSR